jgi:uncharacterized membrane protein (DUF4010 family)
VVRQNVTYPAEINCVLTFGAMYAVVLVAVAWLSSRVRSKGLYGLALVSGLADVDANTGFKLRLVAMVG